MPVTNLNKIVAQLLTGGVMLFFVLALHGSQISPWLKDANQVVVAFLVLPLAALIGAIVDGLSEVTIQKLVRKTACSAKWACFFARREAFEDLTYWRDRFLHLAKEGNHYEWLFLSSSTNPVAPLDSRIRSVVAGSFLRDAKAEEFQWLVQHYSAYTLASNLACVIGTTVAYAWIFSEINWWWWPLQLSSHYGHKLLLSVIALAAFLVLYSFVVDKWLYGYELATRHVCLALAERGKCLALEKPPVASDAQPNPRSQL